MNKYLQIAEIINKRWSWPPFEPDIIFLNFGECSYIYMEIMI